MGEEEARGREGARRARRPHFVCDYQPIHAIMAIEPEPCMTGSEASWAYLCIRFLFMQVDRLDGPRAMTSGTAQLTLHRLAVDHPSSCVLRVFYANVVVEGAEHVPPDGVPWSVVLELQWVLRSQLRRGLTSAPLVSRSRLMQRAVRQPLKQPHRRTPPRHHRPKSCMSSLLRASQRNPSHRHSLIHLLCI